MQLSKKGFTLIELLVVISIIATLLIVALPNFLGARQRARDSQKKATLQQLKTALRLYYNDYNSYPPEGPTFNVIKGCGGDGLQSCPWNACASQFSAGGDGCSTATVYMKQLPLNSGATALSINGSDVIYRRMANTDDFRLYVDLTNSSDPDLAVSQARCPSLGGASCTGSAYCVCAD